MSTRRHHLTWSDFTISGAINKYEGFCKATGVKNYPVAIAMNILSLLYCAVMVVGRVKFGWVDYVAIRTVYMMYIPSVVISLVLLVHLLLLRRHHLKHWVAFYNVISLSMEQIALFGIYFIFLQTRDGVDPLNLVWVAGLVIFEGAVAVVPLYSIGTFLFFYIGGFLAFRIAGIPIEPIAGAELGVVYLVCVVVSYIRFDHEYNEYLIAEDLRITTAKATELAEEAQRANLAKGRFLAQMSHEIRTPINSILGNNEMIRREIPDGPLRDYAEDVESSGRMLLSLINDILDISKIEAGKMDIVEVPYSLAELVTDIRTMIDLRASEKSIMIITDLDKEIPNNLIGDMVRVKQVATNIVTNAIKYTQEGSVTITLRWEDLGENRLKLIFIVQDTGIGMRQEDIDHLYDQFTRFDLKKNQSVEGSGLGMNITLSLLNLMNGEIQVDSTYGEGSVFTVSVPQRFEDRKPLGDYYHFGNKQEMKETPRYKQRFNAPDARVLVVDDNRVNCKVAKALLKATGMDVITVESAAEMFALIEKEHFDIILLDHMMPVMDGIEALREMQKREHACKDSVVIALTANAGSGTREMYLKEGFHDYLAKPIIPEIYEEMMMKYLPKDKIIEN